jgi:hypothetical protein
MSYIVVKTVKGRQYLYEQRTWREGKRVRTESRYLGPLGGQHARAEEEERTAQKHRRFHQSARAAPAFARSV